MRFAACRGPGLARSCVGCHCWSVRGGRCGAGPGTWVPLPVSCSPGKPETEEGGQVSAGQQRQLLPAGGLRPPAAASLHTPNLPFQGVGGGEKWKSKTPKACSDTEPSRQGCALQLPVPLTLLMPSPELSPDGKGHLAGKDPAQESGEEPQTQSKLPAAPCWGAVTSREGWGGRPPAFPTAASAEDEGFLLAVVRLAAEAEAHAGVEGAEVSLEPLRDAAMTELHRDRVE